MTDKHNIPKLLMLVEDAITEQGIRHDYRLQHNRRTFTNSIKLTGNNSRQTQSLISLRPPYPPTYYTHCQHIFYKHHTDDRQAQHTKVVNAGRGCNRRPYRTGILQSRSHNCFIGSHECLLLFTPSCCSECFYDL